jgi:hypothetical protein
MAVNKHEIGSDRRSAGCAEIKAHAIPNLDWASLQGERAPRPTSGRWIAVTELEFGINKKVKGFVPSPAFEFAVDRLAEQCWFDG